LFIQVGIGCNKVADKPLDNFYVGAGQVKRFLGFNVELVKEYINFPSAKNGAFAEWINVEHDVVFLVFRSKNKLIDIDHNKVLGKVNSIHRNIEFFAKC
jgi:hypothetical protein